MADSRAGGRRDQGHIRKIERVRQKWNPVLAQDTRKTRIQSLSGASISARQTLDSACKPLRRTGGLFAVLQVAPVRGVERHYPGGIPPHTHRQLLRCRHRGAQAVPACGHRHDLSTPWVSLTLPGAGDPATICGSAGRTPKKNPRPSTPAPPGCGCAGPSPGVATPPLIYPPWPLMKLDLASLVVPPTE